jgi:hypothetical protein
MAERILKKTIIEECNSKEELCERERYWIITLKANTRGIGYNICEGGTWGDNLTNHPRRDELRANQSMRMKGRKNSNYGNRWSKEQREAASARRKQNPTVIDKETGLNIAQLPHNRKKNSESKMGLDNPNGKLWRLISPIGEEFVIEGGIKRELKRFGLNHRQFQIGVKINENTRVNKNGWVLVRNEKPTINGLT